MSKKLNLTVSGEVKRKKVIIERDLCVTLGDMFKIRFDKFYLYLTSKGASIAPSGTLELDYGKANPQQIRECIEESIRQVEAFDKEAALAELRQALEQVDDIVELVK